jgi:hypothetical protein
MALLQRVPGVGFMHGSADELDRQLREGDGLAWAGDPRLDLRVGVLSAHKRMQHPTTHRWVNRGDMIAKRYEVWRYNEDGTETLVAHWRIDEFDRILFDLQQMRAGAEGLIPDVIERIDVKNAKVEAANDQRIHDSLGAARDHAARLAHDLSQPKHTFRQMPGLNPAKQD